MSYILDALNKSESDRQRQSIPNVESLTRGEDKTPSSFGRFALIILAVVIVNAAIVYYFMTRDVPVVEQAQVAPAPVDETSPSAPAMAERTPNTPPAIDPQTAPVAEATSEPAPVTFEAAEIDSTAGELITPEPRPPIADSPLPVAPLVTATFADLPSNVQRRVPEMNITTHIYSSDPALRMVKIDDIARREGDSLKGGLRLVQITEVGVVLGIDSYEFRVDILQDWNPS